MPVSILFRMSNGARPFSEGIDMENVVVTKVEAAKLMKVSTRTIENWVSSGEMPKPTHIGRRCYWHKIHFDAWLNSRFDVEVLQAKRRGRPRNVEGK